MQRSISLKSARGRNSGTGCALTIRWPQAHALLLSLAVFAAWPAGLPAAANPGNSSALPAPGNGLFDDPVIARGTGLEIKRSELESAFVAYRARMAERKQEVLEGRRPFLEKQLLEGMIVTKLASLRGTAEDKAKARERTEKILAEYKINSGGEEALRRQLKLRETTLERFTADVVEEETARLVMERELKSTITISEAQVAEFYNHGVDAVVKIMQDELERLAKDPGSTPAQLAATKNRIDDIKKNNLARLELPEKVKVAHILFATRDRQTEKELSEAARNAKRELAEKVLAQVRAGESFTNLVQQHSEDRNLGETQGEYWVMRNDPFVPEFKAAAFSLTNNQVSDIVQTIFGYHIIKRLDYLPTRKVELEKASAEIRKALLDQEFERQLPEYFAKLKKEAKVEVLDPKYRFTTTAPDTLKPGG